MKGLERHIVEEDGVLISKPPYNYEIIDKINELVDAVNEIQDPCKDPAVYKVMKEKDEIIAKHIAEKNQLQKQIDIVKSKLKGINRLYSHAFYNREDWPQVCMEMVDLANQALEKIEE